ncbi:nicotinamide riboside transporter PnuC [Alteromonas aestuariivivens]|uniref:Nicotinamide riboside transporter PnuC n=1 Tax=Alteromonas aestuariivivens TaxID=1938339 RepID=A0A3D8M6W5_9ALTE|nr:nicotinamide mononucleotide transporter family protein [Alteromonas aestuariivivens]RDV25268.1 nicotinamide riboside transporter PnuC [Alteromonas aestuariivivens]
MQQFVNQIAATSLAEWLAVVLALAYVWLAARQNSWCWLCAFVSTSIYTWLFWQVTLPFQAALNVFYMVMAVYGYYQWGKESSADTGIRSWPLWWHLLLIPALWLAALGLANLAASQFSSQHLWLDASIQLFSVITTFMVAHKVLQNWLYWVVIDIASAYLCLQTGLLLSACLFLGYVGFAVYGYWQWNREWEGQYATEGPH